MLYDIIVSLIVASSSGGVFVCGNSANWPGTSTNAGKKPASCQLESGQCHKAGCFFFFAGDFFRVGSLKFANWLSNSDQFSICIQC